MDVSESAPSPQAQKSSSAINTSSSLLGAIDGNSSVLSRSNVLPAIASPISPMRVIAIKLDPGMEIKEELQRVAKQCELRAPFILTCVGSVSSAQIRLAGASRLIEQGKVPTLSFHEPFEIVSLTGTLSDGDGCHLHVSLSDSRGRVVGGHVLNLTVNTTAEIIIGEAMSLSFARRHSEQTGYKELEISDRIHS